MKRAARSMARQSLCVWVVPLDRADPVTVVLPRGGRARFTREVAGVRWLTVRTWWGRAYLHWPVRGALA